MSYIVINGLFVMVGIFWRNEYRNAFSWVYIAYESWILSDFVNCSFRIMDDSQASVCGPIDPVALIKKSVPGLTK